MSTQATSVIVTPGSSVGRISIVATPPTALAGVDTTPKSSTSYQRSASASRLSGVHSTNPLKRLWSKLYKIDEEHSGYREHREHVYDQILNSSDRDLIASLERVKDRYLVPLFEYSLKSILDNKLMSNGINNGSSTADIYPHQPPLASLKLIKRIFLQMDNAPKLSEASLRQLEPRVGEWSQAVAKLVKSLEAEDSRHQAPAATERRALLAMQFWAALIAAFGGHIVISPRELTNGLCVVMGAGFKSSRLAIVHETLHAWRTLITTFAIEKQWSTPSTRGKVYSADRRLELILKALRHRMDDQVNDEVCDVWWELAKSLGGKLAQVFDERDADEHAVLEAIGKRMGVRNEGDDVDPITLISFATERLREIKYSHSILPNGRRVAPEKLLSVLRNLLMPDGECHAALATPENVHSHALFLCQCLRYVSLVLAKEDSHELAFLWHSLAHLLMGTELAGANSDPAANSSGSGGSTSTGVEKDRQIRYMLAQLVAWSEEQPHGDKLTRITLERLMSPAEYHSLPVAIQQQFDALRAKFGIDQPLATGMNTAGSSQEEQQQPQSTEPAADIPTRATEGLNGTEAPTEAPQSTYNSSPIIAAAVEEDMLPVSAKALQATLASPLPGRPSDPRLARLRGVEADRRSLSPLKTAQANEHAARMGRGAIPKVVPLSDHRPVKFPTLDEFNRPGRSSSEQPLGGELTPTTSTTGKKRRFAGSSATPIAVVATDDGSPPKMRRSLRLHTNQQQLPSTPSSSKQVQEEPPSLNESQIIAVHDDSIAEAFSGLLSSSGKKRQPVGNGSNVQADREQAVSGEPSMTGEPAVGPTNPQCPENVAMDATPRLTMPIDADLVAGSVMQVPKEPVTKDWVPLVTTTTISNNSQRQDMDDGGHGSTATPEISANLMMETPTAAAAVAHPSSLTKKAQRSSEGSALGGKVILRSAAKRTPLPGGNSSTTGHNTTKLLSPASGQMPINPIPLLMTEQVENQATPSAPVVTTEPASDRPKRGRPLKKKKVLLTPKSGFKPAATPKSLLLRRPGRAAKAAAAAKFMSTQPKTKRGRGRPPSTTPKPATATPTNTSSDGVEKNGTQAGQKAKLTPTVPSSVATAATTPKSTPTGSGATKGKAKGSTAAGERQSLTPKASATTAAARATRAESPLAGPSNKAIWDSIHNIMLQPTGNSDSPMATDTSGTADSNEPTHPKPRSSRAAKVVASTKIAETSKSAKQRQPKLESPDERASTAAKKDTNAPADLIRKQQSLAVTKAIIPIWKQHQSTPHPASAGGSNKRSSYELAAEAEFLSNDEDDDEEEEMVIIQDAVELISATTEAPPNTSGNPLAGLFRTPIPGILKKLDSPLVTFTMATTAIGSASTAKKSVNRVHFDPTQVSKSPVKLSGGTSGTRLVPLSFVEGAANSPGLAESPAKHLRDLASRGSPKSPTASPHAAANSTEPFMPELVGSEAVLGSAHIAKLANVSQLPALYLKLKAKRITTVGQFAQLTEHDVQQLPIKQPNRVEKAREVLREAAQHGTEQSRPGYSHSPIRTRSGLAVASANNHQPFEPPTDIIAAALEVAQRELGDSIITTSKPSPVAARIDSTNHDHNYISSATPPTPALLITPTVQQPTPTAEQDSFYEDVDMDGTNLLLAATPAQNGIGLSTPILPGIATTPSAATLPEAMQRIIAESQHTLNEGNRGWSVGECLRLQQRLLDAAKAIGEALAANES